MRKYLLSAAVVAAAAMSAAPVQAITINFAQGSYAVPSYVTPASRTSVENFESFDPGSTYPGSTNAIVTQATIPGEFVDPDPTSNGKYLAVQGDGSYTANLGGSQVFSFILGSLDNYNTLELTLGSGVVTLIGGAIIGQPGSSAPFGLAYGNPLLAGRVTYDLGGMDTFVSAKFTSSSNSFEIDDLVTAAPEPATWGMMILGFGLAGAQLRSRRRNAKLAVA